MKLVNLESGKICIVENKTKKGSMSDLLERDLELKA